VGDDDWLRLVTVEAMTGSTLLPLLTSGLPPHWQVNRQAMRGMKLNFLPDDELLVARHEALRGSRRRQCSN
jgi:hypothetical protein